MLPGTAKKLGEIYLAKGVHATTAIEGNTLSEAEVLAEIRGTLQVPKSQSYLAREVQNIIQAYNQIEEVVFSGQNSPPLSLDEIKGFNRLVLEGLPLKEGGQAGEISPFMVGVARYRGAPREECEYLLNRLCQWLEADFKPMGELGTGMALLQAILAHLYIAWIHPFADGNGRTARLLEFRVLLARGVPAPASHLLSDHYNRTRAEYYRQLDHASQSGGDIVPFIRYALEGFRDGLRKQIEQIQKQQLDVMWHNYIHDKFRRHRSASDKRRRELAIAISEQREPAPNAKLRFLTPELAVEYAGRTQRTVSRDINKLRRMHLVHRISGRGYKASKHLLHAFLPRRKKARTGNAKGEN